MCEISTDLGSVHSGSNCFSFSSAYFNLEILPQYSTIQFLKLLIPPAKSPCLCYYRNTSLPKNLERSLSFKYWQWFGLYVYICSFCHHLCPRSHCAVFSCSVMFQNSLQPHELQPTRLLCPWEFSRQEYWSGLPFPPPGDISNPGFPNCRLILYHLSHQGSPTPLLCS